MDAAFERNFAVVRERQVLLQGAENETKVIGSKSSRGAAAEIDGMDGVGLLRCLVRPHFDFANELLRIFVNRLFLVGVLIEHAVEAPRFAERNVDVGKRLRRAGRLRKFKKALSRVLAEKGHPARS